MCIPSHKLRDAIGKTVLRQTSPTMQLFLTTYFERPIGVNFHVFKGVRSALSPSGINSLIEPIEKADLSSTYGLQLLLCPPEQSYQCQHTHETSIHCQCACH